MVNTCLYCSAVETDVLVYFYQAIYELTSLISSSDFCSFEIVPDYSLTLHPVQKQFFLVHIYEYLGGCIRNRCNRLDSLFISFEAKIKYLRVLTAKIHC